MSEHIPAEIHIGGPVPRAVLPELFRVICEEGVSMEDYDGPQPSEADLKKAFREDVVMSLYDAQACFGQFEALEAFLAEHHIHFDRHSDAHYEFDGENVYYRGEGEPLVTNADQRGNRLVPAQDILGILNAPSDADAKVEAIRELVDPPQAKPIIPIHFV